MPSEQLTCPHCRKNNQRNANYCGKCGAPLLFPLGRRLGKDGRYVIQQLLGRGGFGAAYLATDTQLDRRCVVKRLMLKPSWDEPMRRLVLQSFDREARMLVTLNTPGHPNIPEIYEYLAQQQCLVMKYVEGKSLGMLLKMQGTFSQQEALHAIRSVCSALVYMHSRSPNPILHRDIKPDNILLDSEQRVWLIDFGLVKGENFSQEQGKDAKQPGTIAGGTPGYTPPEQWGGKAEPRSDVYALAVTLHTLLTGQNPPMAGNLSASLEQMQPPIDDGVMKLIQQATIPFVTLRPDSSELLAQIDKIIQYLDVPAPPPPERPPLISNFVGRTEELAYFTHKLTTDRLIAIAGFAGVGKTALASELLRQSGVAGKVFWHSFHKDEGMEVIVWKLAGFLAWHGQRDLWTMLHTFVRNAEKLPDTELLVDYLLNMLEQDAYLFCFDDFHLADENPLIEHFIRRLYRQEEGQVKIILTMRHILPFLNLHEVDTLDGLTAGDTRQFLFSYGLSLPEDLFDTLYRKIEGNSQLLLLTVEALQRSTDREQFVHRLHDSDDIERYLLQEVDQHLTELERSVMKALAILEGYPGTRDAMEAILDTDEDIRHVLSNLSYRCLILVSDNEDNEREYRQHAIVQTFYYGALSRRKRLAMHRRAAEYYETEEEDMFKAAYHLHRAGEHQRSVNLLLPHVWTLINQGKAWALHKLLADFAAAQLDTSQWAEVNTALGEVCALVGDHTQAQHHYEEAMHTLQQMPEQPAVYTQRARIYRKQTELLEYSSPHDALALIKQGLEELQQADQTEEAILHMKMGSVLISTGDFKPALEATRKALNLLPVGSIGFGRAMALMNLGVINTTLGEIEQGIAYYRQALEICEKTHNYWGMLRVWHNLGFELDVAGKWDAAEAEYAKAHDLAKKLGSKADITRSELALGTLAIKQGKAEAAIAHLTNCLNLSREGNFAEYALASQASLADVHIREQELDTAWFYLVAAEQLAEEIGARDQMPEIFRCWSLLHLAMNEYQEALSSVQRSLDLANELDAEFDLGPGLRILGKAYLANGQHEDALHAFAQSFDYLEDTDPYEAACTLKEWGMALLASDGERGNQLLRQAYATFAELGAQGELC
jgi:serine/threonine protein kinase/Flp pilus assembly protein TadD